jgi:hypothetical protein
MDIQTASFSGHESFPLRNTWLTKGVQACAENPRLFSREDAMVTLGVGKNMVRAIRHWCLAAKMLEEHPDEKDRGRSLYPTELGRSLFVGDRAWDPYLEDVGTLWLIHWLLVTNPDKATTWFIVFNHLQQPEFTKASVENAVRAIAARLTNVRVSDSTLKRDVEVFIRTYVSSPAALDRGLEETRECPLTELGLVYEQPQRSQYAFMRGPKESLPDSVFYFALAQYAERQKDQKSVTFDELAYAPGSVGRAFKLDEGSLAERLDRLAVSTHGTWQFSETAGYKQVIRQSDIDPMVFLNEYYRRDPRRSLDV